MICQFVDSDLQRGFWRKIPFKGAVYWIPQVPHAPIQRGCSVNKTQVPNSPINVFQVQVILGTNSYKVHSRDTWAGIGYLCMKFSVNFEIRPILIEDFYTPCLLWLGGGGILFSCLSIRLSVHKVLVFHYLEKAMTAFHTIWQSYWYPQDEHL